MISAQEPAPCRWRQPPGTRGTVYAIEQKADAVELIRKNKKKFRTPNVETVYGKAPAAMEALPVPTHAFIGGSSGQLKEILTLLLEKNPKIHIVVNAITLETVAEMTRCCRELPLKDFAATLVQTAVPGLWVPAIS